MAATSFPVIFVASHILLHALPSVLAVQSFLGNELMREIWIGIVADLAYHTAWMLGGAISRFLQVNMHFASCAVCTSVLVTMIYSLLLGPEFGLPVGLATVPHARPSGHRGVQLAPHIWHAEHRPTPKSAEDRAAIGESLRGDLQREPVFNP